MLKLREYQTEASKMIAEQLVKGGVMRLQAPTGMGRTITVLSALNGRSAVFISNIQEMRNQAMTIAKAAGIEIAILPFGSMRFKRRIEELANKYDVVIMCETMRDRDIEHPCVIYM